MYARYCTSCPCVEGCRAAFGAYWADKSANGVGCDKPFDGKGRVFVPPPAHPEMTPEQELALFNEDYRRRVESLEETWEVIKDLTPRERDAMVCIKHNGRYRRRYT